MSTTSFSAPMPSASAAAAVSALMLCTTPSASGAIVDTTGIRPAAMRSSTASGFDRGDVADEADVGRPALDEDGAPGGGEQVRVLAGDADRVRAVRVDQADEFAADLPEQHHPHDVHHLGRGDPEAAAELTCQCRAFQHGTDLRAAAVHHHRVHADRAQERHVGGEGRLEHVVDHRVAAVFHHDELVAELLQPRQCLGEDVRLLRRRSVPRGVAS